MCFFYRLYTRAALIFKLVKNVFATSISAPRFSIVDQITRETRIYFPMLLCSDWLTCHQSLWIFLSSLDNTFPGGECGKGESGIINTIHLEFFLMLFFFYLSRGPAAVCWRVVVIEVTCIRISSSTPPNIHQLPSTRATLFNRIISVHIIIQSGLLLNKLFFEIRHIRFVCFLINRLNFFGSRYFVLLAPFFSYRFSLIFHLFSSFFSVKEKWEKGSWKEISWLAILVDRESL